jgi:hypothetical protein
MIPQKQFHATIREAAHRLEDDSGEHLAEHEWVAYFKGQLNEKSTESARAHLICCSECRKVLLEVRDLLVAPQGRFYRRRSP